MPWRTLIFLAIGFAGGVWSERADGLFAANLIRALTLFPWLVWWWWRLARGPREIDLPATYEASGPSKIIENRGDEDVFLTFDGPA